jgi:hypothetical protein
MTVLMQANSQWANRAPDERFPSIEAMHKQAVLYRDEGKEVNLSSPKKLASGIDVHRGQLVLRGRSGKPINFTNWSFGQLCREASAPPSYLSTLPAQLARECLQTGLKYAPDDPCKMLFRENGDVQLRALTSPRYSRIWNADLTGKLVNLKKGGTWQEAPAAFDGSRGQYLSDRDMFAFFVDSNRRIFEKDPGGGLSRGFFLRNSEVGYASLEVLMFFYEYCCGNHRVWGATNVQKVRIRHIGDANERGFAELVATVKQFAEGSAKKDEACIERMRSFRLGTTRDETLARLFNLNLMPKKTAEQAYNVAVEHEDWYGDPNSAWGVSGGITQIARDLPNADDRLALDRVGAKVMQLAI